MRPDMFSIRSYGMRKSLVLLLVVSAAIAAFTVMFTTAQNTGVVAEAVGTANLRAGIGTDTEVVGSIASGTRYPVIGRSAQFPWLLLGDIVTFQPIGWVFLDLVNVSGNLDAVPLSEVNVLAATPTPLPTLTPTVTLDPSIPTSTPDAAAIQPTPTISSGVYGNVSGEINLRYGPGADYPRLGGAFAGDRLEIVGYHVTLPWVLVTFPTAPNGVAWVSREVLDIVGDYTTTRLVTQMDFSTQPTLTPTPAVLQQSSIERDMPPVPVSQPFAQLGNAMWDNVLRAGFDPTTSKFAAMYLRNLKTGEEITFGNHYAFSGTSISKIAILTALFSVVDGAPEAKTAGDIGNMIICSDNSATNEVLARIGGGDMYAGAERTTQVLNALGLQRTFLTAPFDIPGVEMPPPTRPIRYPSTSADQVKARPDLTNQMTVDEVGYLLESLYECAYMEDGPLLTHMDVFTPQECRKILYVLDNNTVDAFAKAGVPEGTVVAHKHGWKADTHGNAALVLTPGGDYVLVMMAYQPEWLVFSESLPLVAETSRLMYNYLNPDAPLAEIRDGFIPETQSCNYMGSELAQNVASPYFLETNTYTP